MDNLKTKAEELRIGLIAGVYEVADVIQWANSEIVQLEKPPLPLLDLAMMGKAKSYEVEAQLILIPGEADSFDAMRKVLAKMYSFVKMKPEMGIGCAGTLYEFYIDHMNQIPKDLERLREFDEAYYVSKRWGGEEEVLANFLDFLKPFAERTTNKL